MRADPCCRANSMGLHCDCDPCGACLDRRRMIESTPVRRAVLFVASAMVACMVVAGLLAVISTLIYGKWWLR